METNLTFMVLHVTDQCNLRCVYCYERDRPGKAVKAMDLQIATTAVDWLIRQSGQKKNLRIVFFGGEPLMNFPLIRETVAYANNVSQSKGKTITYEISTNGTLLTREIIHFFKEHKIVPTISMDGTKVIQDRQRPFKNGKGSHEKVVLRIRDLLDAIPQTGCNAILMDGKNHRNVFNELRKLGFKKIGLSPPNSLSPARQKMLPENILNNDDAWFTSELLQNSEKLLKYINARDIDGIRSITQISPLVGIMELIVKNVHRRIPCGAGRSSVAVSPDGDIFPCHRFTGLDQFRLGNVSSPQAMRNFNSANRLDETPACQSCNARHLCAGGCPHDNFMTTGNHTTPSGNSCGRMQKAYSVATKLADSVDDSDLKFLSIQHFFFPEECTLDFKDSRQSLRSPGRNLSRVLNLD